MTEKSEPKSKSIRCINCGHDNLASATFCLVCDAPLTYTSRFNKDYQKPTGLLPPTDEMLYQTKREEERLIEHAKQSYQEKLSEKSQTNEHRATSTTTKTGTKCPDCGYINRVGDMFCIECGANIVSVAQQESPADVTQQINELAASKIEAKDQEQVAADQALLERMPMKTGKPELKSLEDNIVPDGCFQFTSDMRLRFMDIETGISTEISPNKDKPLLIGRSHESLPIQPEIDLTPFLMEQHGVSRRHALLRLRDLRLEIQDLNSTNGTGINGFRFQAKETHQIRNGDIMTLGRVSIKVTFVRKDSPQGKNVTDRLDG